jgi:membrane protein involved in colicin uptake
MNQAIAEGKRLADIQKRKEEAERKKAEIESEKKWEDMQKASAEAPQTSTAPSNEKAEEIHTEEEKAEETAQSDAMWLNFSALLTIDQALKLKKFFEDNNIEFKKI